MFVNSQATCLLDTVGGAFRYVLVLSTKNLKRQILFLCLVFTQGNPLLRPSYIRGDGGSGAPRLPQGHRAHGARQGPEPSSLTTALWPLSPKTEEDTVISALKPTQGRPGGPVGARVAPMGLRDGWWAGHPQLVGTLWPSLEPGFCLTSTWAWSGLPQAHYKCRKHFSCCLPPPLPPRVPGLGPAQSRGLYPHPCQHLAMWGDRQWCGTDAGKRKRGTVGGKEQGREEAKSIQ